MKKEFSVKNISPVAGVSGGDDNSAKEREQQQQDESYHGQVLERGSGDEGGGEGEGRGEESLADWHVGKLKFKKHIDDMYRMSGVGKATGSDGRNMDDYTVIDPRQYS